MLWSCFDVGNYRSFLQGPLPVANYTRIIIPGSFWTRPPLTTNTRMASSATPPHDSLIELANAHGPPTHLRSYLNRTWSIEDRVIQHANRPQCHPNPILWATSLCIFKRKFISPVVQSSPVHRLYTAPVQDPNCCTTVSDWSWDSQKPWKN